MSQPPAQLVISLGKTPDDKLPDEVYNALLDALRMIGGPQKNDIILLDIEEVFRNALSKPWKEPKNLRSVLEACRQGTIESETERRFYQYGGGFAVVALSIAAKSQFRLFDAIEKLSEVDTGKLVAWVLEIKDVDGGVLEMVEEFKRSAVRPVVGKPSLSRRQIHA